MTLNNNSYFKHYVLIILILGLNSNFVKAQVSESDSLALVALFSSTNGGSWTTSTNWLSSEPVSTWHGVFVSGSRVTQLNLSENNVIGAIPSEIGDLDSLLVMSFSYNQVNSIPNEIGNLEKLIHIDFENNQLSTIPASIGNLTNLTYLNLMLNQVTTIPSEIGNLIQLESLHLSSNNIANLPVEFWNLTNLISLNLNANQISVIPEAIGNLSKLEKLYLNSNDLNILPSELWTLNNLQHLDLGAMQLSSISSDIGNLVNLTELGLNLNPLVSIPIELWDLNNLQYLGLVSTNLTAIPSNIGNLINLVSLNLSYNRLISLPDELWNLTNLQYLSLKGNGLTSISDDLSNLTKLEYLRLENNQLVDFPDISALSTLNNITQLDTRKYNLINDDGKISSKRTEYSQNRIEYPRKIKNNFSDTDKEYILPTVQTAEITGLSDLKLYNNKLTFEDIEPNVGVATNFEYSPQDAVGEVIDATLNEGDSYSMSVSVGGTANQYQWKKDDTEIPGATTETYEIVSSAASDAGVYTCDITNAIATELTLHRNPITLSVTTQSSDCISGSIIYNTVTGKFNFCEDGVWVEK